MALIQMLSHYSAALDVTILSQYRFSAAGQSHITSSHSHPHRHTGAVTRTSAASDQHRDTVLPRLHRATAEPKQYTVTPPRCLGTDTDPATNRKRTRWQPRGHPTTIAREAGELPTGRNRLLPVHSDAAHGHRANLAQQTKECHKTRPSNKHALS